MGQGGRKVRFIHRLKGERGYSYTEVLVAGFILTVALIPMVGSFDTSFQGILNYEKIHQGSNCAKAVVEKVRSLPFYVPYDPNAGDADIDDFFWGDRTPIYDNPVAGGESSSIGAPPDWGRIPEVVYHDYGESPEFADYRATVQLSYLSAALRENPESQYEDTEITVARMSPEWGPRKPGNDRPVSEDGESIHILLVRVNVYWRSGTGERATSLEQIVTDKETLYHLGITRVEVEDVNNLGVKDPERENAGAHYPSGKIKLHIYGYGFKSHNKVNLSDMREGGLNAYLVRTRYQDIPIEIIRPTPRDGETRVEGDEYVVVDGAGNTRIEGLVDLCNPYGTNQPTMPDPAKMAAVGYWSVRIAQEYVVNSFLFNGFIVEYPRPTIIDFGNNPDMSKLGSNDESARELRIRGKNFITWAKNPTPALVRYDEQGNVLDSVTGAVKSIAGTVNYGYSDAEQAMIAAFDLTKASPGTYRLVVYNTDPKLTGHVFSVSEGTYEIGAVPPLVSDAYVEGIIPRSRVIYRNVLYPAGEGRVRLAISGMYFHLPVEVYISNSATDDPTSGDFDLGDLVSVDDDLILADFDGRGLPVGKKAYRVFVHTLDTDKWGRSGPILSVWDFAVSGFALDPAAGVGLWENYYDIPCRLTGSWLEPPVDVAISSGATLYDDIEYSWIDENTIRVNLNLVGCPSGEWKLRVYAAPGYYREVGFTVSLGPAVILPVQPYGADMYALQIERAGEGLSYEYTGHSAEALADRQARFQVRGMGFPVNGTTALRVWGSIGNQTMDIFGSYLCRTDRARKQVYIVSDWWTMPPSWAGNPKSYECHISVQSPGYAPYEQQNRWILLKK